MGHLKALDGFRGLAVLLVMWSHFIAVSPGLDHHGALGRLLLGGHYGVDMFFVLSGFLITGILLDAKGSPGYFRVFIMRRVLRIFPLYYMVLAAVFLGPWLLGLAGLGDPLWYWHETDSPWWFWLYSSNWGQIVKGWGTPDGAWLYTPPGTSLGHFWSLAVEEQFYLLWPWVVVALGRRKLGWLCASFLLLAPVMAALLSDLAGNTVSGYVSTVGRFNTLGCGALLAIAVRHPGWLARAARPSAWLFPLSALLLLASLAFEVKVCLWKIDSLSVLVPLCFGSGLVCALRPEGGAWSGLLSTPPMRFLGKYSYGLYVYHHLLMPVWVSYLWVGWITPQLGTGPLAVAVYMLAAGAASIALAMLSWALLENPCLKLKRFFSYQKTT
ncbi:MAG: acyltransferase [Akkermansiaceae bacterium]|nr:acyltransferase [Akkermansiaceae bacterium]